MVHFTLQCNPTFERISRNINAENSHRFGEEYTYRLPKGQYKLYTPYCRLVSEGPIDFLLNMASSSIIAINIIIIIIIIIIIVHHRRRRPKSLIRFGKSLNERFPADGEEEKKTLST